MPTTEDLVQAASDKMRAARQSEEAIRGFASALRRVRDGTPTLLPSAELDPAAGVQSLDALPAAPGPDALARLAVIKLNGGLATSMGLEHPKSLLQAREGRTFLDIIVGQTLELRRRHRAQLPLVLMDSDATRAETLAALRAYPDLPVGGLAPDFLQSMVPKLDAETLAPVSWPASPALEWCPPGHGDIYGALRGSGMLDALRERGFRYAMISNSDNLGATIDPRIVAHLAAERIPFLMEVVLGTEAERKAGHIARRRSDGRLVLREVAQTPADDADSFRDYRRWRYYNTNTLWVDLEQLAELLDQSDGALELSLIVNRKTVDPRDAASTPVVQLESAMGAAIGCFPGARLLLVPRRRFVPVKTTNDLLLLRSDVYELGPGMDVLPVPEHRALPFVDLDERFFKLLDQFDARFPEGPLSLRSARRFVVRGDVTFGAGVVARGDVELNAPEPTRIGAGTVLGSEAVPPGGDVD
jgi:UTP--glucose-1-phosphate uridylyltransferase